jgi:putative nucleotidyltransferase with HDIG domain
MRTPSARRTLHEPAALVIEEEPHRDAVLVGLRDRVLARLSASKARFPMLSATAGEALRLAGDPNASMKAIENVVSRDPQLAGRLLGLANSSAYARGPVRGLGPALQRLGTGTVRDILYQAVMECTVLRGTDERVAVRERDHAVAVGRLARIVCGAIGFDHDYAFVCGLLHDVGRPVVRAALVDEPLDDTTREAVVQRLHGIAGVRIAEAWALPAVIREAIARHHDPKAGEYSQIGHAIAVAARLSAHYGCGCTMESANDGLAIVYELGLDPAALLVRADADFRAAA